MDDWDYGIRGPTQTQATSGQIPRGQTSLMSAFWLCWPFTGTAQWTHTSGKPRNFLRQIYMCQHCCRQVLWQLCALAREAFWQRIIQSVQLMWGRQDSCLMPDHYGVGTQENRASETSSHLCAYVILNKHGTVGDAAHSQKYKLQLQLIERLKMILCFMIQDSRSSLNWLFCPHKS